MLWRTQFTVVGRQRLLKRSLFKTLVALLFKPFYHKLFYIFDRHCILVTLAIFFFYIQSWNLHSSILPSQGGTHAMLPLLWFQNYMVKCDRMRLIVWLVDMTRQWWSHTINLCVISGCGRESNECNRVWWEADLSGQWLLYF